MINKLPHFRLVIVLLALPISGSLQAAETEFHGQIDANTQFGFAVAGDEDIDNDGFDDIIVGAPSMSWQPAHAYVFRGGPFGLEADPVFTVTENWEFGSSVALGDWYPDGYPDLAVGDPFGTEDAGGWMVAFGGPDTFGDETFLGESLAYGQHASGYEPGVREGSSLAEVGDVDGDNIADLLHGTPGWDNDEGLAYLQYGDDLYGLNLLSTTLLYAPDDTDTSGPGNAEFGSQVGAAGNLNGDAFADIAVNAPFSDGDAGALHIYMGALGGPTLSPNQSLYGDPGDEFATSFSGRANFNADNYGDLIVGVPGAQSATGEVHVFLGTASGISATPSQVLSGSAVGDRFGHQVLAIEDFNGDGYGDAAIASPGAISGEGMVEVFYGSITGLSTTPSETITANSPETPVGFGSVLARSGDVNGDSYTDFVAGLPDYESGTGALVVVYGVCIDHDEDGQCGYPGLDCNDENPLVFTGAPEFCNNVDDDCDGEIDEDYSTTWSVWYADNDTDLYGDPDSALGACNQPDGYTADNTDCDDMNANIYPGAIEIAGDGIDQDCDGFDLQNEDEPHEDSPVDSDDADTAEPEVPQECGCKTPQAPSAIWLLPGIAMIRRRR